MECGKWETIEKSAVFNSPTKDDPIEVPPAKTVGLAEIQGKNLQRIPTGITELDRVLGGGVVPGSLLLLGGEPGIGKSTLALQLAAIIPQSLYISAEESVEQIKLRADRLKIKSADLRLVNEAIVETISSTIKTANPTLAIVDSIQTIYSSGMAGEPGNLNQVRTSTIELLEVAKAGGTAIIIIGHVTKEGTVAGPKTLEHLVDTVLYLEGERHHNYRLLRAVKNRFGSTDEVGIFEMEEGGLTEVKNPSAAFIQDRGENMPGSILTCLIEGTRPLLVEVQALVNKTSFGYPARKASGFDLNRLHVLVAVLQKRAGLDLGQYDIHVNIVGGLKADEPAADLAVCLAIASSFKDKALGLDLVVFGEVGLGGEVRSINQADKRIKEAAALGMKRVITADSAKIKENRTVKIIKVKNIQELIKISA